ncbi:hypothetical protein Tco_0090277 [Tanacetum coccineum]
MGTPTQVCVWSCPNFSAPAGHYCPYLIYLALFLCGLRSNLQAHQIIVTFSEYHLSVCQIKGCLPQCLSTQADGAQSSRVPMPLPEDPYEAIRQAYLDGTDTKSEPFEDPIDTETPESPLAIAPPISLSESNPPVLVPILRRMARMVVRVPHAMSSGLFAGMAEVATMSEFVFCKRFWSSYESSPSVSPPELPSRKCYRGTSELVKDSKEDDDEEDEEIEESMDSDSVSEDAEDEGPTTEDEDPVAEDEGLTAGVEGPGMDDEGYGLDDESHGIDDEGHSVESDGLGLEEEEEAVPGGQQQAAPVVGITVSTPLGLGYGALRHRELALEEGDVYSTFEVGQGSGSAPKSERPERVTTVKTHTYPVDHSGSLPISPSPSDDPSPISSPMIPLIVPSPVTTHTKVETEGFLTELGAQVQMQGGLISDHAVRLEDLSPTLFERYDRDIGELFTRSGEVREDIFSQRYRFRSLEYEQERVAVTFGAIWRPVLRSCGIDRVEGLPREQPCACHQVMWGEKKDLRLQLVEVLVLHALVLDFEPLSLSLRFAILCSFVLPNIAHTFDILLKALNQS